MEQLAKLWEYQQVDLQVDRIENGLRQSPQRQTLLKVRNYLKEQQQFLARIEKEGESRQAFFNQINEDYNMLLERFAQSRRMLTEAEDKSLREVAALRRQAASYLDALMQRERELEQFAADLNSDSARLQDMRTRVPRMRKEFDALKAQCDEAAAQVADELAALREKRDAIAKGIPPALLKRYQTVKQRRNAPVAMINADQCGGCNMQLAAVVLRSVKTGERTVECENCGRILYMP